MYPSITKCMYSIGTMQPNRDRNHAGIKAMGSTWVIRYYYQLEYEVLVDVWSCAFEVSVEYLRGVLAEGLEVFPVEFPKAVSSHQVVEHAEAECYILHMVEYCCSDYVHALHVPDFEVFRGVFYEDLIEVPFQLLSVNVSLLRWKVQLSECARDIYEDLVDGGFGGSGRVWLLCFLNEGALAEQFYPPPTSLAVVSEAEARGLVLGSYAVSELIVCDYGWRVAALVEGKDVETGNLAGQ